MELYSLLFGRRLGGNGTEGLISRSQSSVVIPYGTTTVGNYAFYNYAALTHVSIPASVTTIGEYAFRGCTGLTGIAIPESVSTIGTTAFSACTNMTKITVNKPQDSIAGAPWGATNATVEWVG